VLPEKTPNLVGPVREANTGARAGGSAVGALFDDFGVFPELIALASFFGIRTVVPGRFPRRFSVAKPLTFSVFCR